MRKIQFKTHPEPEIPQAVQDFLAQTDPRMFLVWEPRKYKDGSSWEPRWEVWVELKESAHPDARNELADEDEWNPRAGCWMRRLQTWAYKDGSFAPIDSRFIRSARMADAWTRKDLFNTFERTRRAEAQERQRKVQDAGQASRSYYKNFDNPTVGPHTGAGDWRHRHR